MTTKTDGPVYRALTSFAHGYSLITEGTRTRSPQGPAKFWTVDDGDDATFTDAQAALAEDVRQDRREPSAGQDTARVRTRNDALHKAVRSNPRHLRRGRRPVRRHASDSAQRTRKLRAGDRGLRLHGTTAQSVPCDTGTGAVAPCTSSSSAPVPRTRTRGGDTGRKPTDLERDAVMREVAALYAREGRWPDETSARAFLRFPMQERVTLRCADAIIVGGFGRPDVLHFLIDTATVGPAAA